MLTLPTYLCEYRISTNIKETFQNGKKQKEIAEQMWRPAKLEASSSAAEQLFGIRCFSRTFWTGFFLVFLPSILLRQRSTLHGSVTTPSMHGTFSEEQEYVLTVVANIKYGDSFQLNQTGLILSFKSLFNSHLPSSHPTIREE